MKKRKQSDDYPRKYNPYVQEGGTNPPPLNCDAYYLFTIFYVLFIPQILLILPVFLSVSGILTLHLDSNLYYSAVPFLAAAVMFLYAYLCIGRCKITKPDNMFGIYLPVTVNLAWQFFVWILFNIFGDNNSTIFIGLASFNLYGISKIDAMNLQVTQMMGWLYNAAILGGFAVGERVAFRRTKVSRQPFHRKSMCRILIGCMVILCLSECIWFYRRKNIIDVDPQQKGYGFAYEEGLSSTNLEPYYVENEDNILAQLNVPSDFILSDPAKLPVLDGAEAAYPVYAAFAYACYEDIDEIQTVAKKNRYKNPDVVMPIDFNNSVIAYEHLLDGECDIFFGARPSAEQQELAKQTGKELVLTPIGKEAFIFFVNNDNPVDGLTADQIRDIYSGKINNWRTVGGKNKRILPFQRPENSGSQTMMEYFMGETALKQPLETEYVSSMGDLIVKTARYQNRDTAIGYSFRYFASIMVKDTDNTSRIKYLSIDGVYPDTDTIRSGEYPLTTELYAVSLADNPNPAVKLFLEWMTSPQGQQIVSDTGYVALQSQ